MNNRNYFRVLWDLGYRRLLPVIPPMPKTIYIRSPGKTPGVFTGNTWIPTASRKFNATEELLDIWDSWGASIGIRCDKDIVALDIDAMGGDWAERIAVMADEEFGPGVLRYGLEPKRLLMYHTYDELNYRQRRFDDGTDAGGLIEFLAGETRFFVARGGHPSGEGRRYRWPDDIPPKAKLTTITKGQVEKFFARIAEELPKAKRGSTSLSVDRATIAQADLAAPDDKLTTLAEVLQTLPNIRAKFGGYDEWIRLAAACRGAFQNFEELGRDAFVGFSENSDIPNPTEDAERTYWSLEPPFAFGYGYLTSIISANAKTQSEAEPGEVIATIAPLMFEEVDENTTPSDDKASLNLFETQPPVSKFTFLKFDEAADAALGERTAPLIKGLLDQGAMSVVYGDSNTGKTFVCMDMGFHIAAGIDYAGMKVSKSVVVYIAAEGGRGAKKRLMALRNKFGDKAAGVQFYLLATSVNLRDPNADLNPLKDALADLSTRIGLPIGLVVVDTMSRALAGGDENSSVDVGLLVKNFDALRAATKAHLMVVHHSGKDRARGARGWSGLRAATDTEIEVADQTISVGKQRDLDKSWSSGFQLDVMTLGVDEDGDAITSCTVRLVAINAVKVGVANAAEQDILDAIDMLERTDTAAARGVSAKMLVAYFDANGAPTTVENVRYYMRQLEAKNLVEKAERGKWHTSSTFPPQTTCRENTLSQVEESGGEVEDGVFD